MHAQTHHQRNMPIPSNSTSSPAAATFKTPAHLHIITCVLQLVDLVLQLLDLVSADFLQVFVLLCQLIKLLPCALQPCVKLVLLDLEAQEHDNEDSERGRVRSVGIML